MLAAQSSLLPAFEGAYPDLQTLVDLHRYARELHLRGRYRSAQVLAGERQTRRRGRGMEFEEVRLYQPGDDIRSIDWRVTARTRKPHTKLYREEQERPVLLAADLRSPMFFGRRCFKSVSACALLSLLGWAALAGRDRVGGVILGDHDQRDIRPKRSKHTVLEWIRQLHRYATRLDSPCPATAPQPLSRLLEALLPVSRPGSGIYIVSDFHDLDARGIELLHRLGRHADLTLFQLYDPLEQHLTELAREQPLWVTDGRRRQPLGQSPHVAELVESRHQQLLQHCAPIGAGVVSLSTEQALLERLQSLYGSPRGPHG